MGFTAPLSCLRVSQAFDLLHPKLREAIKELGYLSPTPVQSAATTTPLM
jgi:superfamily II DNA/RNA helicase